MDSGLFGWAKALLMAKRRLSLSSMDDLKDGNLLLHLWELVAPEQTFNFVPGHVFGGANAATQNIALLGKVIPSPLRLPPTEIGEGSGNRILEIMACWHIGRIIGFQWDPSEQKTLPSLIPRLSKSLLDVVKQDLQGEYIPSLLSLLEKDAKLLCVWMKVQCERVGEQFSSPSTLSGLEHCLRVADTKLSIPIFTMPRKPQIIPLMLFISLFYDRRCEDFEGSAVGRCLQSSNSIFKSIEIQKDSADEPTRMILSETQHSILSLCRDNAKLIHQEKTKVIKSPETVKRAPVAEPESESLTELSKRLGEDKMRYIIQIRDLMNITQKKNQEISELKSKLASSASPSAAASSPQSGADIKKLEARCKELEQENKDLSDGIELLYESESRLMTTNRELQVELDMISGLVEEIDISRTSQQNDSNAVTELKKQNEALKEKIKLLENQVQETHAQKEEIEELNQMVTMLMEEVDNLKSSEMTSPKIVPSKDPDESWKEEMKKLQEEVNVLQEREKIRVRTSTNLSKTDTSLHLRIETLSSRVGDLESELVEKTSSIERLNYKKLEYEKQLKECAEKVKLLTERSGNDSPFDKENPLPSLGAISERLKNLDSTYSLHCCSWRQLGLVLQAKMEPDATKRNELFSKACWH